MDVIFSKPVFQAYQKSLAENGFDSMDTLQLATFEDLVESGMKRGHARLLIRSLNGTKDATDAKDTKDTKDTKDSKDSKDSKCDNQWFQQYPAGSIVRATTSATKAMYLAMIDGFDATTNYYRIRYLDDNTRHKVHPHIILGWKFEAGDKVHDINGNRQGVVTSPGKLTTIRWNESGEESMMNADGLSHVLDPGMQVWAHPDAKYFPRLGTIQELKGNQVHLRFSTPHLENTEPWVPRNLVLYPFRQIILAGDEAKILTPLTQIREYDAKHGTCLIDRIHSSAIVVQVDDEKKQATLLYPSRDYNFIIGSCMHLDGKQATPANTQDFQTVQLSTSRAQVRELCIASDIGYAHPMDAMLGKQLLVRRTMTTDHKDVTYGLLNLVDGHRTTVPLDWMQRVSPVKPDTRRDAGIAGLDDLLAMALARSIVRSS